MDYVYFVCVASTSVTMALSWLVGSYFRSKPAINKTLVDLINSDFVTSIAVTGVPALGLSTLT